MNCFGILIYLLQIFNSEKLCNFSFICRNQIIVADRFIHLFAPKIINRVNDKLNLILGHDIKHGHGEFGLADLLSEGIIILFVIVIPVTLLKVHWGEIMLVRHDAEGIQMFFQLIPAGTAQREDVPNRLRVIRDCGQNQIKIMEHCKISFCDAAAFRVHAVQLRELRGKKNPLHLILFCICCCI